MRSFLKRFGAQPKAVSFWYEIANLFSRQGFKTYDENSDKNNVGPTKLFFFALFFISLFSGASAWAQSVSFRYEGRFQGPGITTGTMTNQTVSVSIQRPDACGTTLGIGTWNSATVTFEDGAFSISPSFVAATLSQALNPWNNFGAACSTPEFRRNLLVTWNGETFTIPMEDSPRANLASYAINASNALAIGGVSVQSGMTCAVNNVLKFNSVMSRFECQVLALADLPALTVAEIPSLLGDVTGTLTTNVVEKIRGVNVSATTPTTGQILKYNGTVWTPSADDAGSTVTDATYLAKGILQVNSSAAISGLDLTSGVLSLPNTLGAAGTTVSSGTSIPILTYDIKGRITNVTSVAASDASKLPLAGGTMSGSIDMNNNILYNASNIGVRTGSPSQLIQAVGTDVNSYIEVINSNSSSARQTGFLARNYSGATTAAPAYFSGMSARGTLATPSQLLTGDSVLMMKGYASDNASTFQAVSAISMNAEESITSTSSAGSLRLATTPTGTIVPVERMRITSVGLVGIGTINPSAQLDVEGGIQMGDDLDSCATLKAGTLRYNSGRIHYCNGAGTWQILANYNSMSKFVSVGSIEMPDDVTFKLSATSSDPVGLVTADESRMWYNNTTKTINYFNGTANRTIASLEDNNSFTGTNTFNSVVATTLSTSGNTTTAGNATVTGAITTGSLKVGTNGSTVTQVSTCANTTSFTFVTSVAITCTGLTAASTCNCQWHIASPPYAITSVVPSSGLVTVYLGGSATGATNNLRCICYNP